MKRANEEGNDGSAQNFFLKIDKHIERKGPKRQAKVTEDGAFRHLLMYKVSQRPTSSPTGQVSLSSECQARGNSIRPNKHGHILVSHSDSRDIVSGIRNPITRTVKGSALSDERAKRKTNKPKTP